MDMNVDMDVEADMDLNVDMGLFLFFLFPVNGWRKRPRLVTNDGSFVYIVRCRGMVIVT
jgi:hypothetical protein